MEPESTRAENSEKKLEIREVVRETRREMGSERADVLRRITSVSAQEGATQSSVCVEAENCLGFFRIQGFFVFLLSLDGTGFGFGGRQGRLQAILGSVSGSATEHTEVVFEMALAFLQGELSIPSKLVRECGEISGGGRLARVVARVLVARFLVGLFFIRLFLIGLVLLGAGLLTEMLVVMGVDGMRESLHGFESGQLALLAHNVFDSFCQSGIVTVTEDGIIPPGTDCKTVEFNIVLHDALIILHLEIVNSVFHVGGGVDGTKLSPEGTDKGGPIVHPGQGSSESSMVGSKYSRAVPRRKDKVKVTFGSSS